MLGLFCCVMWAQSSIQVAEAPTCQIAQIRSSLGPGGAGMGHAYNELIFKNTGTLTCRLDIDNMLFQRMDGADERSGRVRRGNMPTEVHRNIAVNMDGEGSTQIKLAPHQRTAITTDWANRTGYTEADLCATKMRLRLARQPGILLDVSTESCDPRVFVSGFHKVRE
jgi:Protein of unknown function (DUF4232)